MQRQGSYLTAHLLQIALDRSKALGVELQRLRSQQYPPTGPEGLIDLARRTNGKITEDLSAMLADQAVLAAIPTREVEINLRAKTYLLSFLHLLMQYVEGAEMQFSPSTFVIPLRRLLKKHFRNFDFIVRVSRWYNYSILSLIEGIQDVFSKAGYSSLLTGFPSQFFVINCPVSERRNVPIHCVFAHEIGHTLYKRYALADTLLPFVSVDETALEQLITTYASQPVETREGETEATAGDILERWRIDYEVRARLRTRIIPQWVEELTADALALCLLGPAYFFAFVYFTGPFASLDDSSDKHPPDRMRIAFMCNILLNQREGLAYIKVLDETTRDYIEQWKAYASQLSTPTPTSQITFHDIAARAIEPALTKIMIEAKRVTARRRYTPRRFKRDIPLLYKNLASGIPPNEITDDWATGQPRIAESEAILNAGWVYLISRDDRYAKLLGAPDQWAVTNRLFNLVSKGLEYADIQRRWRRKR